MSTEVFDYEPVYSYSAAYEYQVKETRYESGATQRKSVWPSGQSLHSFLCTYRVPQSTYRTIRDFFNARNGRYDTFYFKNWENYQVTAEAVGTGDASETVFQLDHYPVKADSQTIYVNAVEQTEGVDYTLVDATGVITFASPPGSGLAITADYEFYLICVFDMDNFPGVMTGYQYYEFELAIREEAPSTA